MKRITCLLIVCVTFLCKASAQEISTIDFCDTTVLCVNKMPYAGDRDSLIKLMNSTYLQPSDAHLFVTKINDKYGENFIFFLQDTNGYWDEYARTVCPAGSVIDTVSFIHNRITLGTTRENTIYFYQIFDYRKNHWETFYR